MNTKALLVAPALCLVAGLEAQIGVTFPNQYSSAEGDTNTTLFDGACRHQQILSDFKNYDKTLHGLYFRRDSSLATNPDYAARTAEVAFLMGKSSVAGATASFAGNYAASPVTVFTKKSVNLPSLADRPRVQPSTRDVAFPFDTPYVFVAGSDHLWEAVVWSTTAPGKAYPLDSATGTGFAVGWYTMQEFGCPTANGTMELRTSASYTVATKLYAVQWFVQQAPGSVASAVVVGTTNPSVAIPGLCAKLMVDPILTLPGTTSGVGAMSTSAITGAYPQVNWSGLVLQAQAVSLDASKPGIQVSVSNGLRMAIPYSAPTSIDSKSLHATSATATTGTLTAGKAIITHYGY